MKAGIGAMVSMMLGMHAAFGNMDFETGQRTFDNRQHWITKHCNKCGKEFETKAKSGYTNCRKCNQEATHES